MERDNTLKSFGTPWRTITPPTMTSMPTTIRSSQQHLPTSRLACRPETGPAIVLTRPLPPRRSHTGHGPSSNRTSRHSLYHHRPNSRPLERSIPSIWATENSMIGTRNGANMHVAPTSMMQQRCLPSDVPSTCRSTRR